MTTVRGACAHGALVLALLNACESERVPIGADPTQGGSPARQTGGTGSVLETGGTAPGMVTGGTAPGTVTGGTAPGTVTGGTGPDNAGGTDTLGGGGGAGGQANAPIWSANSARIELRCASVGIGGFPCWGSWVADAALLTPEQLAIIQQLTPLTPVYPQPTCDQSGYVVSVTDRSGAVRSYWGPRIYSNCMEAIQYGPELSLQLVNALAATVVWCGGSLVVDSAKASPVTVSQCLAGFSSASSLWARFTLPAGASYTVTAMDGNRGGSANANVALRLYDSTGTTVVTDAQPGASLTVAQAGDYMLEIRNATGVSCQVALELEVAG